MKKQFEQIFEIDEYEDKDRMTASSEQVELETPESEIAFQTPPMRARQAPEHGDQELPSDAIPTRASSTPGRYCEEEWMVRPVRKKRGVTRYEDENFNMPRGQFDLDNFEGEYNSYHCFAAEEDGDQASNYNKVMTSRYNEQWLEAMKSEMKSLEKNKTWKIVDIPQGQKAIGCKWIFRMKSNPDGSINKFKARLMAEGFTKRPGIDYVDTLASVARKESINDALEIAATEDLEAENVDVNTAFFTVKLKNIYTWISQTASKTRTDQIKNALFGRHCMEPSKRHVSGITS